LLERWNQIAASGRELEMIVPEHYDVFFLGKECDSNYPGLIKAGAHLYRYARAIMHTKVVLMDSFYTITGSYNLNLRSARADMECTILIQDSILGKRVGRRLEKDLEDCRKMIPSLVTKFKSKYSIPVIDALLRYLFF
jgi:cardiolipin synthase